MSTRIKLDSFLLQDPDETVERIKRFLATHYARTRASSLIVGMSGGLDSTVTAWLCALAVGGKNVIGVSMPEKETWNKENIADARNVARKHRMQFKLVDITPIISAAAETVPEIWKRRQGLPYANLKARLRAVVLYYYANKSNGLVVGTSDKSEAMLGYFTKFGDGACDLAPLADLYKTTVRDLARHLGLPKGIREKPPSPELWPGQTAKKELKLGYDQLDPVLWGLERWMSSGEIAMETGLDVTTINRVRKRWLSSEHKRRPPLALKLGFRTAGSDLRLPQTVGGEIV